MNSVSTDGTLTRKISSNTKKFTIKHSLRLLLPPISAGWRLTHKTPAVASQHI